jgi:GTPase
MFIDETRIYVKGGDGGKGCLSFAKTVKKAFRGPDGGSGGKGGHVYLQVNSKLNSLLYFRFNRHQKASPGAPGKRRCDGKNSQDLVLEVPLGTCVYLESGELLADLCEENQKVLLVQGGRGGRGNRSLITRNDPVPRHAENGEPGQELWIKMELKLSANLGIIGFPNIGKSTLIRGISRARPKVADYPFTTLEPNLGMVQVSETESFLVADIPGIIEGAHKGLGLGTRFLRHVERTGLLLHMVDLFPYDESDPWETYLKVNHELISYSKALSEKVQVVALNKIDLPGASERQAEFLSKMKQAGDEREVFCLSALIGTGVQALVYRLAVLVNEHPSDLVPRESEVDRSLLPLKVFKTELGFQVEGSEILRICAMTNFAHEGALLRLHKLFERRGIIKQLQGLGAREGDLVFIGDLELEFQDEWSNEEWSTDQ